MNLSEVDTYKLLRDEEFIKDGVRFSRDSMIFVGVVGIGVIMLLLLILLYFVYKIFKKLDS